MIAATLFSGIGAPECAMPDWDWRWCAEIEKFPSAVLRARHPKSVNLGDINAKDFCERAEKAGRPNVLVFGSPCQDFSVAGRRVGLDGDRGNLALVALGIVNRLRPRWVVFENVPGLLSSRSGSAETERQVREGPVGGRADSDEDSDFAAFLALVQQCGYLGCYRITDAQYAGVPQRRRRIFAVFHIGDWRPAAAVLFEPEGLRGDHPPSRETGQGFAPTISARPTAGGGLGTDFDLDGGLVESTVKRIPRLAKALRSASGGIDREDGHTLIVDQLRNPDGPDGAVSSKWSKGSGGPAGDECYNLVTSPVTTRMYSDRGAEPPDLIAFTGKDYGGVAAIDQAPTLRAMEFDGSHANGGGQIAVAINLRGREGGAMPELSDAASLRSASGGSSRSFVFKPSHYTRGKDGQPSGVSPPLGAEPDKGDQDPNLMTGTAVRRLTPRECERLQAFPDDYTLIQYRGSDAADGPRYKALGNAMNVKEIGWVLQRIQKFEQESTAW